MQSSQPSKKPASRQMKSLPPAMALKLRSLLASGDIAAIELGFTLLESLEAPTNAWESVFSDQTLRKIVTSWDPEVWRSIASRVSQRGSIIRRFTRAGASLFQKLSGQKQKRFLESLSELDGPEACLLEKCFAAFTGPDTRYGVGYLNLDRLKSLSDTSANIIAKAQCGLSLSSLSALTETGARSLRGHEGFLGLGGLKALPDVVAEAVSGHRGWLDFRGVQSLSEKAAVSLLKTRGMLALEDVALSERQAELLSDCKCRVRWFEPDMLDRNRTREKERLQESLAFMHRDGFRGKNNSFDTSASLAHYHRVGYVAPSLSIAAARALLTCPGFLSIDVRRLTDAVVEVLATHEGGLGITCPYLSDSAAANLARTSGPLVTNLNGGRNSRAQVLSRSAAKKLARHHDYVALGRERDLLRSMH